MRDLAVPDRSDADHRHVQGIHVTRLFQPAIAHDADHQQHGQGRERGE